MNKNKRFTIKEFSTLDAMASIDVICDDGIELPTSTACDLLNKISDENKYLKTVIGRYNYSIDRKNDEISNLHLNYLKLQKEKERC